jgi:hypothetical protein
LATGASVTATAGPYRPSLARLARGTAPPNRETDATDPDDSASASTRSASQVTRAPNEWATTWTGPSASASHAANAGPLPSATDFATPHSRFASQL